MTVLVVEDEPLFRSLLAWMLTREGYKFVLADDGAQALAMSRDFGSDFHAVITDVCLPRMSGIELAAELRAVRPDLKALFISGLSMEEIVAMGGDVALSGFVPKPFNLRQIAAALRALTDRPTGLC